MTTPAQGTLPDADAVERRFRSKRALVLRAIIHLGLDALKWILDVQWKAEGIEHIKNLDGPFIIASNHSSHADTHVLLRVLPDRHGSNTAVAAAYDYFGTTTKPSLKRSWIQFASSAGWHAFGFDRNDQSIRSLRTASRLIRKGWNLLLYPEGTRSRTGRMGSFKPGIAVIARLSRCPVIPTCVVGGRELLKQGRWFPRHANVHVYFGAPMIPHKDQRPEEFAAEVEQAVRDLMAQADPPAPSSPVKVTNPVSGSVN